MHKWTIRAARVALVAAAITAAGAGVANADNTTGDHSILGGEQIHIPIIAPIGLFGNHVNLLSSVSGARYAHVPVDDNAYDNAYAQPQMDICGNAISTNNGVGTAACKGQAQLGGSDAAPASFAPASPAPAPAPAAPVAPAKPALAAQVDGSMIGAPGAAIGAPGSPVAAPVAASAAAPAAAQDEAPAAAPAAAQVEAPAATPAEAPEATPAEAPAAAPVEAPIAAPVAAPAEAPIAAPIAAPVNEMSTSGDHSIAGGNQIKAPVRMPIRICGNAGAIGGMATAACEGTASSGRFSGTHRAIRTFGVAGLLG